MCTGAEILFIGQSVQAVGGLLSAGNEASQYSNRAGEILANAKEEVEHTSKIQERRRGGIRAAYGKSGVKLAGTAKKFIDAQIKEDERELLSIRYNASLQAKDSIAKASSVKVKGFSNLLGDIGKIADSADKSGIFKKGAFGTGNLGLGS